MSKLINSLKFAAIVLGIIVSTGRTVIGDEHPAPDQSSVDESSAEVEQLLQLLVRPSFIQRDWATRRLIQQGPDVVPSLIAAVRASTEDDLSRAVIQLLEAMSGERDPALAGAALRGLTALRDNPEGLPDATQPLITAAYQKALRHTLAVLMSLGAEVERGEDGNIDRVSIHSDRLTDRQLLLVGAITSVTILDIRGSSISGDGLPSLEPLIHLERLNLTDTPLTGDDLRRLPRLPRLRQLQLYRVPLSDDDRRWLQNHLPGCTVFP